MLVGTDADWWSLLDSDGWSHTPAYYQSSFHNRGGRFGMEKEEEEEEGEEEKEGEKTSSCPSVVAGQSSGIRLSRLSYLDDAPSPLSSSWLAALDAIVS